ncbi:MAG TPA: hypothetical protein VGG16_15235 [Streptosporangiaceae bacterium]
MKIRMAISTAGLAAGLAAGALVAGTLAAGTAVAQAAPAAGHSVSSNPLAACRKYAKDHTFVWITKAKGNPRYGLTVTGQTVRVHCGGPDDLQYNPTGKHFTGHLLRNAKINVLTFSNGIQFPRMPQSKFTHWVATDHNSGIYSVTGPFKAIRALAEEYHP